MYKTLFFFAVIFQSLLFAQNKDIYVPYPIKAEIYDRNGDGIGDSLRVAYSRKFHRDSLPSKLLVTWEPDTTFEFGLGTKIDERYSGRYIRYDENRAYWNHDGYFKIKMEGGPGTSEYSEYSDSIIVIYDNDFSRNIKTSVGSGNIGAVSWATFEDIERVGVVTDIGFPVKIEDKIPAVVVKAVFYHDEKKCGTISTPCEEVVKIILSEPIKANPDINEDAKRAPFAYKLLNHNIPEWNYYQEKKNLPLKMVWGNDSIVRITYSNYKETTDATHTPVVGDSVRFAWEGLGYYVFTDLVGNKPNPKEIGRRLEGIRFEGQRIPISGYYDQRDILKDALMMQRDYGLFRNVNTDTLFSINKPVTFIPVPGEWNAADSVKQNYPGSIGYLFIPHIDDRVSEIEFNYGVDIPSEDITLHARVSYLSAVERKQIKIKCNDPIFQINGTGGCRNGAEAVYVAWNLKNDAGNFVNGCNYVPPDESFQNGCSYIQEIDFHWEIIYKGEAMVFDEYSNTGIVTVKALSQIRPDLEPIRLPQISSTNSVLAIRNAIHLQVQNSARLDIYNIKGKLEKTLHFNSGVYSVPLGDLPKGMYIAKASFGSEKKMLRIPIH